MYDFAEQYAYSCILSINHFIKYDESLGYKLVICIIVHLLCQQQTIQQQTCNNNFIQIDSYLNVTVVLKWCLKIRFTPVPDSVLHSALMSGEKMTSLDARQQVQLIITIISQNIVIYISVTTS